MTLPIILIQGPTAAGKTQIAIELTEHFPCEIISVDSAMVYKGMDIGTGKPSLEIRNRIPHHLIDIVDPAEIYSAGRFVKDAHEKITSIFQKKKIPLLVGGTMLYFKALLEGIATLPTAQPEIRSALNEKAEKHGWEHLHQELMHIDPSSANRIHPNDTQRIQRALEVYYATGKTLSSFAETTTPSQNYQFVPLVIAPQSRIILHEKIAARFYQMLEEGFIEEVKHLHARQDLSLDLPSMRAVGYKQIYLYLDGQINFETMQASAIAATRQLAKRQFTWLNHASPRPWFDSENKKIISFILKYIFSCIDVKNMFR